MMYGSPYAAEQNDEMFIFLVGSFNLKKAHSLYFHLQITK